MAGLRARLAEPLKGAVKRALAGDDVDALVGRRDRRRLRWMAQAHEDPVARFRALRALAELGAEEGEALFLAAIGEEPGEVEAAVARVAAEGLGRLRRASAGPALRRLLNPERPAQVQGAAARALAALGGDGDWSAIRGWAPSACLPPDQRDHAEAIEEGGVAGTVAVALVLQPLFADKGAAWWASKARAWLEGEEARPRIPAMEGADRIVAQQLRTSLTRKDLDAAELRRTLLRVGALSLDRDQGLLSEQAAQPERRRAALQALGLQGDPRSLPALLEAARSAVDDGARQDAARALGRLGWRGSAAALVALRDAATDEPARLEATFALGELGGEDAVRALMDDLRKRPDRADPSDAEYAALAAALRRCGARGREAIRGARTIAISAGERRRVQRVAELAGIP